MSRAHPFQSRSESRGFQPSSGFHGHCRNSQPHRGRAGAVRRRRLPVVRDQRPAGRCASIFVAPLLARRDGLPPPSAAPTRAITSSTKSPGSSRSWCRPGTKRRSSPRCSRRRSSGSTMTITGSSSAITATIRRPRRRSPASPTRASRPVQVEADGPTTKADCLNHLYDALIAYETGDTARPPRRSCCTTPRMSSTATSCGSSTD